MTSATDASTSPAPLGRRHETAGAGWKVGESAPFADSDPSCAPVAGTVCSGTVVGADLNTRRRREDVEVLLLLGEDDLALAVEGHR